MVFGGIFGVVVKCTLADHVGFEFASRNRHRLMQVQASILIISLVLNVAVLVTSLIPDMSVANVMPLVKLFQEKSWYMGSDGVQVPFATIPSPDWLGFLNFEVVCVIYYVAGATSFCRNYTLMDTFDAFVMTGERSAWVEPSTNTLCAVGNEYPIARYGTTTSNGAWIASGMAALFPYAPNAPYVQPGGGCVDALQTGGTFTYGAFSGANLTCYVAPSGGVRSAAALSPNPLNKLTEYVGCYPPRPECKAMACADLGFSLHDSQLRPPIWGVCSIATFSTKILLIASVALGAAKVVMLLYFGMRKDPRRDKDKKGFNLITLIVPFVGMVVNIVYFHFRCINALTFYDSFLYDRGTQNMEYSRAVPTWGIALVLMTVSVSLYVPCALIELSIPAGQYAFRGSNLAPPPPSALEAGAKSSSAKPAGGGHDDASKAEGGGSIFSRMIGGARGALPMVAVTEEAKPAADALPPPPSNLQDWHASLRLMLASAAQCLTGQGQQLWQGSTSELHSVAAAGGGGGGGGGGAEPRFHVLAWEGPRAGECNADTVALSELIQLREHGMIPDDVVVWPQGATAAEGAAWRPAVQIVEAHKRRNPAAGPAPAIDDQSSQQGPWWSAWWRNS